MKNFRGLREKERPKDLNLEEYSKIENNEETGKSDEITPSVPSTIQIQINTNQGEAKKEKKSF